MAAIESHRPRLLRWRAAPVAASAEVRLRTTTADGDGAVWTPSQTKIAPVADNVRLSGVGCAYADRRTPLGVPRRRKQVSDSRCYDTSQGSNGTSQTRSHRRFARTPNLEDYWQRRAVQLERESEGALSEVGERGGSDWCHLATSGPSINEAICGTESQPLGRRQGAPVDQ